MKEKRMECAHCQNKPVIVYKEIAQGKLEICHMCAECPFLKQKFPSDSPKACHAPSCPSCRTQRSPGEKLGCPECYQAFADTLIRELSQEGHLPLPLDAPSMQGKQIPLHVGKSPEQRVRKGALSARLETLHLALGEAIAFENYEEAAALRDQIKELMEKHRGVA